MKIDIEKTFKKSVGENTDFHFYLDELASDDSMPTYAGCADEKYTFDEMSDEFFEFIQRKVSGDGIFIRLVFATSEIVGKSVKFHLEYGMKTREFLARESDVQAFESADYGVKIKGDVVSFGATVAEGCGRIPCFAEFGSKKASEKYLSLNNPLNQLVAEIMMDFVVCGE